MTQKRWSDLSPRTRRLLIVLGLVDGSLKTAALIDLKRRPADQVRGPKWAWALAITFINSLGIVPLIYFTRGRR